MGMFLLGLLGGFILNVGLNDRIQPLGFAMAISVFSLFVRPEVNIGDIVGGVIRLIFLWWLLRMWLSYQNRHQLPGGEKSLGLSGLRQKKLNKRKVGI
jgi:hypothetical protein